MPAIVSPSHHCLNSETPDRQGLRNARKRWTLPIASLLLGWACDIALDTRDWIGPAHRGYLPVRTKITVSGLIRFWLAQLTVQ